MELTFFWYLQTGIPVLDNWTRFYFNSCVYFLGLALRSNSSIGLRSKGLDWAGHSITLILLNWNRDAARFLGCSELLSPLKHSFQRRFLYSNLTSSSVLHNPWCSRNWPNMIARESSTNHQVTVLTHIHDNLVLTSSNKHVQRMWEDETLQEVNEIRDATVSPQNARS